MHPKDLSIKYFFYNLPEDKIAFHPLENRAEAKLLVFENGQICTDRYQQIGRYLPCDSLMVFNNTKVVEARLLFKKETGTTIEVFCLQPHESYPDIASAMLETGSVKWLCLVGGASKWKSGQILSQSFPTGDGTCTLRAALIEKRSDCFVVALSWNGPISFAEVLHQAGHVPLPPYIKRADETADKTRYQTVYARFDGSVAAPTAGLHFTQPLLDALKTKNITPHFVTLHVGAGTFRPVKAETMVDHEMHAEYIEVDRSLIAAVLQAGSQPVIAVGTTSLRTLESLFWLGSKLIDNPLIFKDRLPFLGQWDAYEKKAIACKKDALQALLDYLDRQGRTRLLAKTQLIIAPGYSFQMIAGLVTNFHQPGSTLLLLVAALVGQDWRKIYDYALENEFRFLSYGDGSLLLRSPGSAPDRLVTK